MPSGVPMRLAAPTMIRLSTIALRRPPSLPGGCVIRVKRSSVNPPAPSRTTSKRIQSSQKRPNAIAVSDSASAMRLTSLRRECSVIGSLSRACAFVARQTREQQLRRRENEERDEEEDEAELDQRGGMEARVRF